MAGVGIEKFEEYFQKTDADCDGQINGAEAVTFLQGSNLLRQVLAQIWMHADQNCTLKLVTVRVTPQPLSQNLGFRGPAPPTSSFNQQSGTVLSTSAMNQQLRPVPSSTGMNQELGMVSAGGNQQSGTVLSTSGMNQQLRPVPSSTGMNQQLGMVPSTVGVNQQLLQGQPASPLNHQYGQVSPNTNVNPQFFPSQGSQMRPPISMPTGPASRPPQVASGLKFLEA
ncbi:epidermal growth factor receptor substrate 15-like 1 [Salvia divinorum]|uniref:Epidermal growth factor receptor substrate 15-like 1 n=1 Tax=Salvia divinorum TaxID=28513 RepID=A0ABD1FM99_SALDI